MIKKFISHSFIIATIGIASPVFAAETTKNTWGVAETMVREWCIIALRDFQSCKDIDCAAADYKGLLDRLESCIKVDASGQNIPQSGEVDVLPMIPDGNVDASKDFAPGQIIQEGNGKAGSGANEQGSRWSCEGKNSWGSFGYVIQVSRDGSQAQAEDLARILADATKKEVCASPYIGGYNIRIWDLTADSLKSASRIVKTKIKSTDGLKCLKPNDALNRTSALPVDCENPEGNAGKNEDKVSGPTKSDTAEQALAKRCKTPGDRLLSKSTGSPYNASKSKGGNTLQLGSFTTSECADYFYDNIVRVIATPVVKKSVSGSVKLRVMNLTKQETDTISSYMQNRLGVLGAGCVDAATDAWKACK